MIDLGLEPHNLGDTLIDSLFEITKRYAYRVRREALLPTVNWRSPKASSSLAFPAEVSGLRSPGSGAAFPALARGNPARGQDRPMRRARQPAA